MLTVALNNVSYLADRNLSEMMFMIEVTYDLSVTWAT